MSEEEEGRCSAEHDMATEVRQKRQLAKVRPENHSFSDPYSFHSGVASLMLPACASLVFVGLFFAQTQNNVACFLHQPQEKKQSCSKQKLLIEYPRGLRWWFARRIFRPFSGSAV